MEGRIKLGKRLCAWMLSFALLLGLAPGVVIRAEADAEKTVWEGSEQISWNADIPGTQFETPEGTFSGLAKGDVINVYTTKTEGDYGDPQYAVTYKAGDEWKWTDLTVNVSGEGAITYTVESDQIATEIADRGLIFRGQAYTITKITVTTPEEETSQPENNEKIIWTGTQQISWNADIPGTQFETPEGTFSGLAKGDVINVYTTKTEGNYGDPQYAVTYKAGDEWKWTDLTVNVSGEGTITYTVESDQIATEIADRGLIFRGQAYTITKITVTTPEEETSQPENNEKIIWTGTQQISWNADIPGTQFETPEGTFSGLAKGDVINVYTTVTEGNYGDPQYAVTYKAGDEWKWTDLTVNVSGEGTITYTVESDQIATEIAQRGLIFRGQAWTATKITVEASGSSSSGGGEGGQGGGETSTHTITLQAFEGNYSDDLTDDAFSPYGTKGTDCFNYKYTDGQSTTVTVQYVVWSNRYLQKIVVDGVKQTVTGQNQTFTFNDSADHTITAYYKYSSTPLSAGDIAIDPPWSFTSGTDGWSRGYDWNYGATTTLDHDASKGRLTLTGVDYTKQNDKDHLNDAGKLSVGFDAADPFTLAKGTNCLKLKLGYNFSDAAKDLTVKVTLKSPGDTEVVKEAARLVSVSDSGSSEVSVLFPALTADTQIKSVTLDIYSATYQGNLWIDDVSFAHVDTCKITLSTDNGKWRNIFQVNGQPISVDNDDAKTVVLVEKGSNVTVTVARRPDGDNYWLTALRVDGFNQTVTEQDQTVTLRASVDHTVTACYEYSGTLITPIAPAVSATPVTTTTNEGTATVAAATADEITSALKDNKAAGIKATSADNVALDEEVVTALAAGGSNKGSNGIVAVIKTQNATVEAPAAMFASANSAAVTLQTAKKDESAAASDSAISHAVAGKTGKVEGAVEISLVKTGDGTNVNVEVDAAKPITIRTTVAPGLTKRLLHIGYINKDGALVYDNTVQLLDYVSDSDKGELSFTTTHYTTFVFVSDPSLTFYNGRLTVKNKAVGFNATDWALEKGTLSIDKSGRLSMTGLALPTQPGYSDDGSEYASTSYSSGDYYVLKWAGGEISDLDGVNMVDLTIDYDLSRIVKDSGNHKWDSATDLLVSVFVRGREVGNCKALSLDPGTDGGTVEVTFDLDTMRRTVGSYNVNTPELEFRVYAIGYGGSYPAATSVQLSGISLYSVTKYRATFSATVGFDHVEDSAFKMGGLSVFGWEKYYSTYAHTRNVGSPVVVSANVWTGYRLIGLKVNDITPSDFKIGKEYTVYVYQNGTTIEAEYASVYSGATVSPTADIAVGGNPVAPAGETVVEAAATVKDGVATVTVEAGDVKKLLAQAKASEEPVTTITLAPALADGVSVTKTELSISAADLGTIGEGSEASLKIDSPIAAITITSEAVEALAAAGEPVTFTSEIKDDVVDIAVTSGGERLASIAGGIRAEVAVEAAPGLTAILLPAKEENTSSEALTRAKLVLAAPTAGIAAAGGEEGTPIRWAAANQRGDAMLIKLNGSARVKFVDKTKTFADVPPESWGASAVNFVSGHGIFDGYDDGKFYPNAYMNRAMLVKILHNFEGDPAPVLKASFRDVPANAWYADAVAWASGSGVVGGIGDNWFDVNSRITRQDAVTILYRYMGEPEVTDISILDRYDDRKSIAAYAEKAMAWALEQGIISGVSAKTLAPREAVTRHQVARLMMDLVMSQVQ